MTNTIDAVVFDMGGVLVDLGPITHLLNNDADADNSTSVELLADTQWARWLNSTAVRDYEMGLCDVRSFGERFVAEAGLTDTASEFIARFQSWPNGLFEGATAMVASLTPRIMTAVLSNTNALHWHNQRDAATIQGLCDRNYLSFELGLAKPDAAIFEHVIADLGCDADHILFLDDNQINVDAALRAGMHSALVRGVEQCRAVLTQHQLLR